MNEDTVENHKSAQYDLIAFDQLETFTRHQFFYAVAVALDEWRGAVRARGLQPGARLARGLPAVVVGSGDGLSDP